MFSDFFYLILVETIFSYYDFFSIFYILSFQYNCFYVVFCTCCDFLVFYIYFFMKIFFRKIKIQRVMS